MQKTVIRWCWNCYKHHLRLYLLCYVSHFHNESVQSQIYYLTIQRRCRPSHLWSGVDIFIITFLHSWFIEHKRTQKALCCFGVFSIGQRPAFLGGGDNNRAVVIWCQIKIITDAAPLVLLMQISDHFTDMYVNKHVGDVNDGVDEPPTAPLLLTVLPCNIPGGAVTLSPWWTLDTRTLLSFDWASIRNRITALWCTALYHNLLAKGRTALFTFLRNGNVSLNQSKL